VRSKADEIASLIWCTVQKRKKKLRKMKIKTKTEYLRRNGPANSPWRQSGRKKWNCGGRICERGRFQAGSEKER